MSAQLSAVPAILPTDLSERLEAEGTLLVKESGDYGYGGEWVKHYEPNAEAITQVVRDWLDYMNAMDRFSDHDYNRLMGSL